MILRQTIDNSGIEVKGSGAGSIRPSDRIARSSDAKQKMGGKEAPPLGNPSPHTSRNLRKHEAAHQRNGRKRKEDVFTRTPPKAPLTLTHK